MEFASFLAGERWSDDPACTHPLLGQLARRVNDLVGDAGRQELVPLVPSVVGRVGDDHTWITLPVTVAASPILEVPEATQRVLAAGLLSAQRVCVQAGPELAETGRQVHDTLDLVPQAVAWAEQLPVQATITSEVFSKRCAPTMIRCAVDGIVESGTADRDARLRALLEVAIAACPVPTPMQMHRAPNDTARDGSTRAGLERRR
jgi:hypothetical protein